MVVIHSSGIVTVNAVQRRWPAIGGSTGTNRSSDNWLNEPVGRGEKIITRFSANTKCNRSSMPSLDKHHGAEFENSVKSAYVCNTRSLLECNHKEPTKVQSGKVAEEHASLKRQAYTQNKITQACKAD